MSPRCRRTRPSTRPTNLEPELVEVLVDTSPNWALEHAGGGELRLGASSRVLDMGSGEYRFAVALAARAKPAAIHGIELCPNNHRRAQVAINYFSTRYPGHPTALSAQRGNLDDLSADDLNSYNVIWVGNLNQYPDRTERPLSHILPTVSSGTIFLPSGIFLR